MDEWRLELAGLTPEQIAHGLEVWDDDWPPSSPEFRKACKGEPPLHRTGAHKFFPPSLPKPKAKPEVVAAALEAIRKKPKLTPEQMDIEREKLRSKP